jgi:pimeloyl-ACP methyl ester carboxylesterase
MSEIFIQAFAPRDIPALVIWGERDSYHPRRVPVWVK